MITKTQADHLWEVGKDIGANAIRSAIDDGILKANKVSDDQAVNDLASKFIMKGIAFGALELASVMAREAAYPQDLVVDIVDAVYKGK